VIIESPRWLPGDRESWERHAQADVVCRDLDRLVARSLSVIEGHLADGPSSVGVSWGRDSVVVAHLVWRVDPSTPLWTAAGLVDNPDNPPVESALLDRTGQTFHVHPPDRDHVADALQWVARTWWPRAINGVRADESSKRATSAATHGHDTGRSCRPILWWPSAAVWAYLARHDLPVHPAYAMTRGGALSRDRVRVHSIGGVSGVAHGRREWEAAYYPDGLALRRRIDAATEAAEGDT
jgi:phosphoadenosine phosphosulfate reductase